MEIKAKDNLSLTIVMPLHLVVLLGKRHQLTTFPQMVWGFKMATSVGGFLAKCQTFQEPRKQPTSCNMKAMNVRYETTRFKRFHKPKKLENFLDLLYSTLAMKLFRLPSTRLIKKEMFRSPLYIEL